MSMTDQLVTVTFLPAGTKVEIPIGTNLIEAAHRAGVEVNAVCGGKGSCGQCRGRLIKGILSEQSAMERERIGSAQMAQGIILLCQRKVRGDVSIEMIMTEKQGTMYTPLKGNVLKLELDIEPVVVKNYHEMEIPTIHNQTADLDRLLEAFPYPINVDLGVVVALPVLFREAGYKVTSVVVDNCLVVVEPGDTTAESYGIAFDIGTTSVAGYLVRLTDGRIIGTASNTNKQRTYGADVISRITYTTEHADGRECLKRSILETINSLIQILVEESGIKRERIYTLVLIGNTVMSHLLLGVSAEGVASSPFIPAFSRSLQGRVGELGLTGLPEYARFTLLPNVAGYVGSDTVGVMLATQLADRSGNWLAVDIGTNGEIVLASKGRLVTCSTAAGPAFEGACISQGMRAESGAIYRVDLSDDCEIKVVGDILPKGICGSGLIDCISEMIRMGMLRVNGRIKSPTECPPHVTDCLRSRIRPDRHGWKFVLADGEVEVAITQKDISELQLGKGAVRAGIEILMEHLYITANELDGILVAGAFGSSLRAGSIQGIGMFPPIDIEKIQSVGNAAGTGAVMALLSAQQMALAKSLPQRVEHIELSLHPSFSHKFAQAIAFSQSHQCI